jgi:hypothetical protein
MNIAKLQYPNKETAISDLLAKGVYIESEEGLVYGQGTHAIVELGLIVDVEGTYDEDFNELTAPVYADGYHYDVLTDNKIPFTNVIKPKSPKHSFYGVENEQ